jgi:hypothetical protein
VKYKPNHKAGKLVKINSYEQGGSVRAADTSEGGREARDVSRGADYRYAKWSMERQAQENEMDEKMGRPSAGLPIIVKVDGRPSPADTGRVRGKSITDAIEEKYNNPNSARARARAAKSKDDE